MRNKITLKNIRDHIEENYKHIFPSKEQFAAIHRENQVYNNRNNRIEVDLRDRVNQNSNLFGNKSATANNFKKTQTIRNFEITKLDKVKKNLDFSEKNETILTKNDFTNRMNELQNQRDEFMRNSKKKNTEQQTDISELHPNVNTTMKSVSVLANVDICHRRIPSLLSFHMIIIMHYFS